MDIKKRNTNLDSLYCDKCDPRLVLEINNYGWFDRKELMNVSFTKNENVLVTLPDFKANFITFKIGFSINVMNT